MPNNPHAGSIRPVYLDNQATTRCDPRVLAAMLPWFSEAYGNPASAEHEMGRAAAGAVNRARAQVASLIGADSKEIIFTSGATESNNIAIKGATRYARAAGDPRRRIVTLVTEHKCVLACFADAAEEGFDPLFLPVRPDGLLDPERLREALAVPTLLVSIMAVNNETGVIQDLPALTAITKRAGALFHTDAAQATGKIPIAVGWGIDLLSLSGHKLYGPKGIGALYVRRRPRVRLSPLFSGGGQERGLRSGTLPAPLIVGLGEACRCAQEEMEQERDRLLHLRDRLLSRLRAAIPGLQVNGSMENRIAGNGNITFPDVTAAAIMASAPDLCVSTGSACSSAAIEPSYVLRALGLSRAEAARTLRIGIGRFTSPADIDYAAAVFIAAHRQALELAEA
ncbi:MAG: aminotransferase class V-fold PLP-dependent enzyme [Acetobacteraceae bacterium]|nr:aminotransferase class V-fold PLP-dependent enzyme [Acetobacteraceae bacterium]